MPLFQAEIGKKAPDRPPFTASVWHRPVASEEAKDRLAERQARAAVALVRLGRANEVWTLLRHSADPRLRSFIVNWLNPLGADPKLIVDELARIDPNAKPKPARWANKFMDDQCLFHPETSTAAGADPVTGDLRYGGIIPRRAGANDRQASRPLSQRPRRRHPRGGGLDPAAMEATASRSRRLDAQLIKVKDRGDRRWLVNSQGQTFALIDGPVEFLMGSPPTEPDRDAKQLQHRRIIPRRFAIAAKEVTVEEYREFVKENPGVDHAINDRYSPDPKGPMNAVSWYHAVAYCNWLSRKEGLSECYEPNAQGQYAEGMKIRADALRRTGYRLPTEAEWEYACRAGAGTSRYFGVNVDLLGKYAWYLATSQDHAWRGGSLLPNDLGLFDMLGNVHEWCHVDYINSQGYVDESPRVMRGAAFNSRAAALNPAFRGVNAPSSYSTSTGFRLARTCE